MRSEAETDRAIEKYADLVRRICFVYLKNASDVEDVFQDVFLKYVLHDRGFESDAHEKAWLIRVSINSCKDLLKSFFRKKTLSLEELNAEPFYLQENERSLMDALMKLHINQRNVIYLFYYEGYSAVEIAKILGKKENTIYTWLSRARKQLKYELGGEPLEQ